MHLERSVHPESVVHLHFIWPRKGPEGKVHFDVCDSHDEFVICDFVCDYVFGLIS